MSLGLLFEVQVMVWPLPFFALPLASYSKLFVPAEVTAAVYAWNDQQSWEQAMMVAARQEIEWDVLEAWFISEGAGEEEFQRFRHAAGG